MKRRMLAACLALAAVVFGWIVLLDGPGGNDDELERSSGAGRQVAQVVARLELATRRREFRLVCDRLFTRAARTRAGGPDCVRLLQSTAKDVRRPRIRLLGVRIEGRRAEARVRTLAEGQATVEETIDLERERGRYRIAALRG